MARVRSSLVLGAAVLATTLGGLAVPAAAERLAVRIESAPSGATLYLNSRNSAPLGRTPYRGELAEGTYTLIMELDGHEASVQTIRVKRGKQRPIVFTAELEKVQSATLAISGGRAAANAKVLVDGVEQGSVPDKIVVAAGPHQIEVVKEGFRTFEVWVEPGEGEVLDVAVKLEPDGSERARPARGKPKGVTDPDEKDDVVDDEIVIDPLRPKATRRAGPMFVVGLGVEIASRKFVFDAPETMNLRSWDAKGIVMARVAAQVFPLSRMGPRAVRGLGLSADYGKNAVPITAKTLDGMDTEVSTRWSEFDVGLRYEFPHEAPTRIGAEGGYGGQDYEFFDDPLAGELPSVAYRFFRLGVDGRVALGEKLGLYGGFNYRQIRSVGVLAPERFAGTSVVSFGFGLGAGYALTRAIELRANASYLRYGHTFESSEVYRAAGGTDQFLGFTLGAAYAY
jgi:hypothetical protein